MTAEFKAINRADALRYMGFSGEPDEHFLSELEFCERELLAAARPQFTFRVFELSPEGELRGCDFKLVGEDIARHLQGCEKAAVIAATLSGDVDRHLKKISLSDGLRGMISDALASALAEQTADFARLQVLESEKGLHATWVYAPGYGDFPLSAVPKLLECVDAARSIGLSCTGTFMLTPQKSIVGVAGLSEKTVSAKPSCANCNMREECKFRRLGGC